MHYDWDPLKNEEIQDKHGISFDEIVALISKGGLIKSVKNPNGKYPDQKIMLVRKGNAVFMVPFQTRGHREWLVTAFYSERLTKKYAGRK